VRRHAREIAPKFAGDAAVNYPCRVWRDYNGRVWAGAVICLGIGSYLPIAGTKIAISMLYFSVSATNSAFLIENQQRRTAELFADVEVSNSAEFIYKSRETTAQDFKLISDPRRIDINIADAARSLPLPNITSLSFSRIAHLAGGE